MIELLYYNIFRTPDKHLPNTRDDAALVSKQKQLYRPSDRRLSAKLVQTFADRGCCVVSTTDFL
jgi:hypothetical protein